jgi:glycerophosphoryl diester phosphodiesterase
MNNHVIFIHPDGTSPAHYGAARFLLHGPDGRLNWDKLDEAGVYLGHMEDQLGGTSNAGAVTHATGAKVYAESFGLNEDGSPVESLSGNTGQTIMEEAVAANKVTALLQSGFMAEPGTAAFVAQVGELEVDGQRVPPRQQIATITKQVIESGVDFIMGGGELHMLPVGTDGFHETAAQLDARSTNPLNRPSENLIELAESNGYTVVYNREQLFELLDPAKYPTPPTKVLGVFAALHTFNDRPEEVLGLGTPEALPLYVPTAPTIAEMLEVTQQLAEQHPNFQNGSFTVVEEEGTDNFGNNNNAAGTLEGLKRADAAIGVALDFNERHSNTLILTAADSDAGGLQVRDPLPADQPVGTINNNPTTEDRLVPLDGQTGVNSLPFVSQPDANGDTFPFAIAWAGTPDFSGSIVAKAHGINSEKLPATADNTGMYELMYETLFETELPSRVEPPQEAPAATEDTGNVIFIHPDGTSPSHYMALRNIDLGPDGRLNWDMMSDAGVYLGHMENQLTGTSNAGAVTHATGTKVFAESFGLNEDNTPITPASGKVGMTILDEAIAAGKATALVQSGHIGEPGTAAFAAQTSNRTPDPDVRARDKTAEIAEQVIRSGTNVIMAGGEVYLLPQGTTGFHVTPEIDAEYSDPVDRPSINLIELAQSLGYTVVYTEDQLNQVINSGTLPEKLLGIFAANHTFDDRTEEELGLNTPNPSPLYVATAPTIAEMLDASLKILEQDPDGFFAVVEEEGTDNFGNNNNAVGTIEAMRRADAAIGVAMDYVDTQDPNTLVITAADSEAGGMQVFQFAPYTRPTGNITSDPALGDSEPQVPFINVNPSPDGTPNYLDGSNGSTGSPEEPWESFQAMDSIDGPMGNFAVAWAGTPDFPGSIVAKTYGLNADLLPSTLDNTEIYRIMYQTLFGEAETPKTVYGEPEDDQFDTAVPDEKGFIGDRQILFTGSGNDEVDLTFASGGNRVDLGSGDDLLFAGVNNRIIAGSGDDLLYVGSGGGNNVITGGTGADQFWVVTDTEDLPTDINTITDFIGGSDVIGFANTSLNFAGLTLVQDGQDTLIQAFNQDLVKLLNVQVGSLTETNFVFA